MQYPQHCRGSGGRRAAGPLRTLRRLLAGLLACVIVSLAGGAATAVAQQDDPIDIGAGWHGTPQPDEAALRLPEPPQDYLTERRGGVTWTFPAAATDDARDLQNAFPDAWTRIEEDLGGPLDDTLVIRVARNPEEMRDLAPVGHPPPQYASGVAYPRYGIILLSLTAPDTWERPNMEALLTHELSHVALHRAVEGHPVPRWFAEGLAIYQAGEYSMERVRTLWSASVAGNVVPLEELSARFPDRPHRVNVAYAQSADVVSFLRRDTRDARSFRILIRHVREGMPFDQAVTEAYDEHLSSLEGSWRASLDERFQAVPLIVTGGGLWVLASVLIVVAFVRRKRSNRKRLRKWEAEETAEADAVARAERALAEQLESRDRPEEDTVLVVAEEPPMREPEVPTIEYEGRNHTLH